MAVIVKADLSEVKQYTGKPVVIKQGKRQQEVLFRITADDYSIEEAIETAKRDSNIIMVNYVGSHNGLAVINPHGVYVTYTVDVGNDLTEDDIIGYLNIIPEGVTLVLKLPEDYKNIRFAYNMSIKYSNVRFCGGQLFCFDECKFGCIGRDICSQRGIKFDDTDYVKDGCCCAIPVEVFENVDLEVGKVKQKKQSSNKGSSSKPSKSALFSSLLYGNGKVEL